MAGVEARRSPRVALHVPIRVVAEKAKGTNAHTAVVNRHGALILCPVRYDEGAEVEIWNLNSGEHTRARIVWYGGQDLPGLHKEGVELLENRPTFWGWEYDELVVN
jgi:hypothetical protein